ncbi:arf-GAP with GTPase, ANK repeat and PH domain-containing protein 3-like isoform X2 [Corticium candelabrum]|uniref:arf-GAP with GTPase, ANK repeat and PH domain-containing protein 3-like isoform X2 n=1 Tax=Corticium candelabrum TaxID=121492 RepID=UPI002E261893|nr:arf-GAP with GTPase, ANK repeat and PH domain-containing protein 3-like isoform X2 [Corticium candelabrum]
MLDVAKMDTLPLAYCGRQKKSPTPLKRSKSTRRSQSLDEPLTASFMRRWSLRNRLKGGRSVDSNRERHEKSLGRTGFMPPYLKESQEWTFPRGSNELRLSVVGNPSSGKTLVIHRYLNGLSPNYDSIKYDQFKRDVIVDGKTRLLLIRDITGTPSPQVIKWTDAFLLVFNVCDESSFHMALTYYDKISQEKQVQDMPIILVGTQDAITDSKPRRVSSIDVRRATADSKEPLQCPYMEANAKHGVNVDYIFREICRKMVLMRNNAMQMLSPVKSGSPGVSLTRSLGGEFHNNSPQSIRKSKRKSALFPSSSGSKITGSGEKVAAVFGKGRSVPIKQGDLWKKTKSGLTKEWKKKFVTLTEGKLTYYPSLQDYRHDVHGKEIDLQRTTVKVPQVRLVTTPTTDGQHTKPSKSASSTDIPNYMDSRHDGSVEKIGELAIAAAAMALQRGLERDMSKYEQFNTKKVWGHETEGGGSPPGGSTPQFLGLLKRSSDHSLPHAKDVELPYQSSTMPRLRSEKQSDDDLDGRKRAGSNENIFGGSRMSTMKSGLAYARETGITPNSTSGSGLNKKGHRRRRSWGAAKSLEDELYVESCEFDIVSLDGKSWQFEAANSEELESWVKAIRQQIQESLQMSTSDKAKLHPGTRAVDRNEIDRVREIDGNNFCADCNSPNPQWVSLNLGIVVCINCSGIHRNLGTHLSRVKSLELDDWSPEQLAAVMAIGNSLSRRVYEATASAQGVGRPTYSCLRDEREEWIRAKYDTKDFLKPLPSSEFTIGQNLLEAVYNENIALVFELIAHCTPEDVSEKYGRGDGRTPLHVACTVGSVVLVQFLIWAGADVNAEDADCYTPMTYARTANNQACVDLLLQNGSRDDPGLETPIFVTEEGVVLDELEASVI